MPGRPRADYSPGTDPMRPKTPAGPFFHLIPVFGSAIAIVFLSERPQPFHGIGYALIITGIFVAQRGVRRP